MNGPTRSGSPWIVGIGPGGVIPTSKILRHLHS